MVIKIAAAQSVNAEQLNAADLPDRLSRQFVHDRDDHRHGDRRSPKRP
ncbi:hypothetical protein [Saccharopolyspora sp. NPDC002376]